MRKLTKLLLLFLIFINIFYVSSGVFNNFGLSIDAIGIWLLKAKNFYLNGFLPIDKLNMYPYSHPHYPVLLPFIFALIYWLYGSINEVLILSLYPIAYLFCLIFLYKLLLKIGFSQNASLFYTYIYSMLSPLLAAGGRGHAGEADIFITLGYLVVLRLLINGPKNKYGLIFTSVTVGVMSLLKLEGVFASVIILLMPVSLKQKALNFVIAILPFLAWNAIVFWSGLKADLSFVVPSFFEFVQRLIETFIFMVKEFINVNNWYIFWPIYLLIMLLPLKKAKYVSKINLFSNFIAILACYIVNYIFSSLDPSAYVASSFDRVLLQLSPIFFMHFALKTCDLLPQIIKNEK